MGHSFLQVTSVSSSTSMFVPKLTKYIMMPQQPIYLSTSIYHGAMYAYLPSRHQGSILVLIGTHTNSPAMSQFTFHGKQSSPMTEIYLLRHKSASYTICSPAMTHIGLLRHNYSPLTTRFHLLCHAYSPLTIVLYCTNSASTKKKKDRLP